MNNDKKISIFFLVFIAFFIGMFYFANQNGLRGSIEDEKDEIEIKKYAIQTHEYFDSLTCLKYMIDSKDEVEVFNSKFDVDLKLNDVDFDKYKVFIQLEQVSSGSIDKEISDLLLDNQIIFIIKSNSEGIGTDDMAMWYYVAIIPNSKLEDINYDAWQKPSIIINDSKEDISNDAD